jgi:inositol-phosphate transport system permease protein
LFFNVGLALLLALVTFYMPSGQSKFFRAVWLIPRVSPSVIYIMLWRWLSFDGGFMSYVLGIFGVAPENWLNEFPWTFVIMANGFVGASMGMIIFASAVLAIPPDVLHAAEVDGAYPWQQVRRIILPLMAWPILFITTYQTLSLMTSFEYILLLTDGGPGFFTTEVWALNAYHTALSNYYGNLRYGFGATLAVVLVAVGIALSLIYLRLFDFKKLVAEPQIEN